MTSKPPRKPGYALNRADYIYHVRLLIESGLSYFLDARIRRDDASQSVDTIWDNEARRLIDLQLPNWILIACTNGRFSRANAVEEAVAKSEGLTDRHWARTAKAIEENNKEDRRAKWLPDRQQFETTFLSWVRTNCAAALAGEAPERMPGPPERVYDVWNYVSAALTYFFEEEIATINQYSTYTLWRRDRVSTFLDRLSDWIEIWGRGTKRNPLPVLRTSLNLIMKDRIWDFGVSEIALQLGKPSNEIFLPNREALEADFFARVAKVRAAARRKRSNRD